MFQRAASATILFFVFCSYSVAQNGKGDPIEGQGRAALAALTGEESRDSASSQSFAQEARSFEQLQVLLKPDDTIYVTGSDGSVRKGKVVRLTTESLQFSANRTTWDLSERDILRIQQWRQDSLKNGALIGAGVGLGLVTLVLGASNSRMDWETAAGVVAYTAIGAGVGTGIDALIPSKRTIFSGRTQNAASRSRITPTLGRSRKGLAVAFSF